MATGDPDLPAKESTVLDLSTNIGKRQDVAKKCNDLAVSAFTFAFSSLAMMAYIDKGTDADWPNGHAGKITKALFKKFKPEDIMSKAEMREEISELKMGENEDPSNIFASMTNIEI